jgi:emfourin
MKLKLERSGGITGMTSEFSVDTSSLSPEEAHQLKELIANAHFFDIDQKESSTSPPRGAADYMEYVITIQNGEEAAGAGEKVATQNSHTVKTTDISMSSSLRALVNFILKCKKKDILSNK